RVHNPPSSIAPREGNRDGFPAPRPDDRDVGVTVTVKISGQDLRPRHCAPELEFRHQISAPIGLSECAALITERYGDGSPAADTDHGQISVPVAAVEVATYQDAAGLPTPECKLWEVDGAVGACGGMLLECAAVFIVGNWHIAPVTPRECDIIETVAI